MPEQNRYTEELKVTGDRLVGTIRELIHETNVRHIIVKNAQGETLIEIVPGFGLSGGRYDFGLAEISGAVGSAPRSTTLPSLMTALMRR